MHKQQTKTAGIFSRRPAAGRRLSLILESSLTSNQRHVERPQQQGGYSQQEKKQGGTRHRRSVSFREGSAQDVPPGNQLGDGYMCGQFEQIDKKSQRTQLTADVSESSVPTLIVIGGNDSSSASANGGGGGSVSSFQSALTADTLQVAPVGGGGAHAYASSSAMRIDVDLDATVAVAAGAAPASPAAPAPKCRREAFAEQKQGGGSGSGRGRGLESGRGGGGLAVPSARELLRRAEAKILAGGSSKRRSSNGKINPTSSWASQQGDDAEAQHRRIISSRRSLPADCTERDPSLPLPLPTSGNPLRASTSQPNLTRLTHHYAAQDPGFRKRFSDFVRDQLSGTGGDGGDASNNGAGGAGGEDNAEAALAERIRRVGSYGNILDQLRGYGDESAGSRNNNDHGGDGSAEMAQLMLNGGYGAPAHRRGTDQHHHHNNHVQRLDDGKQITPLPTDSRVTTIKLDNILVQICNTQLTHFLRRERHYRWLSSFRRLDPRYQILTFFNDVSREGGENVDQLHKLQSMRDLNPLLRGFVKASAFSVWRPTSNEAIYKMMRGEAVGKGLDVKGKSARRGVLSGYIPFVQIHVEGDKRRMRRPPKDGRVRVYYQSEEARDAARKELTLFAAHASHAVRKARLVIEAGEDAVTEDLWERALKYEMILDVEDSMVYPLDNYSEQGRFGLDVAERYFVEVSIVGRDISRPSGSEWDVGRNSEPAFQDMNSACVRAFDGETNRAVILQMDDSAHADPLQPQTLVVAYEEHGRVIPVASDFDAFLVGTRGVDFSDPLPPEQVDMMADMIEEINNILSSPATDSWTVRWLDLLMKKTSKNTNNYNTPRYGYGDPKSYDMIEAVARRLEGTSGAVRHGPECFNLVFPQEIDDHFLVVCDSFPGIPWKYVEVDELQDILCDRIDDGFAFPLNPKWVLCDPSWKRVWDKLMASNDFWVQQHIDMWYPPTSGIRERIEEIYREHPLGFQRLPQFNTSLAAAEQNGTTRRSDSLLRSIDNSGDDGSSAPFEGTEAMDLAEQELKYYMIKKRAKMKLKAALMFRKLRSSSTPQKEPKAPLSLLQAEDETLPVPCKAVSILAGGW